MYDLQGCHYHSRDLGGPWKRSAGEMQPIKNAVFSLPILFRFKERGFCNDSWDELVLTSQSMQVLMEVLSETLLKDLQCFCLPCPSASSFLETIKAVGTEVSRIHT